MIYITDREYAEKLLMWASEQNPGRWIEHSRYVAEAAEIISKAMNEKGYDINPTVAYICGILHDIGRYKGITPSVIHSYDGYKLLMDKGHIGNANICVTHSFPIKSKYIESVNGWIYIPKNIQHELIDIINNIEWNIYDELLTLCDALAEANGFTIIERRLVSVAIRNGTSENVPKHWKGFFEIKEKIENIIDCSVYTLFPDIEKSIFSPISLSNRQ